MYHCPACGEMVVAGIPHPDYGAMEDHLRAMSKIRFGDLVVTSEGYFGLVVDPLADGRSPTLDLFLGNGLQVTVDWSEVHRVVTLPGSEAACNFQEFMLTSLT